MPRMRFLVATLMVAALSAAPAAQAAPPARTASKVLWAKAHVPAGQVFRVLCVGGIRGNSMSLLATSQRSADSSFSTTLLTSFIDGEWKARRVGPHRTFEQISNPRGDHGGFTGEAEIRGRSSAVTTLFVGAATWGRATHSCRLKVGSRPWVALKKGARTDARFDHATDPETSIGDDSSEGSTSVTIAERTSKGFLFAIAGHDAGPTVVAGPNVLRSSIEAYGGSLAEPGAGVWRFALAGKSEPPLLPLLITITLPG